MDENTSAINIVGLKKTYGNFTAVDNLDLTVKKGEFMGLLGPNGSGKSTTLKCITGLIQPTSGQILINGIDCTKNHREALAHVGCVIETPEFYPQFTPAESLDYVGQMFGLNKTEIAIRARDVLEEVKMWEWRNKQIGQFSKGMRQRIALAQAMLSNPDFLILDEPTSGLDPRGMIEMRQTLSDLKHKDRGVLISTHILKEVSELCESVTMIDCGKIITSGDVSTLIHDSAMGSKGHVTIELRTQKNMPDVFVKDMSSSAGVSSINLVGDKELIVEFNGSIDDQAHLVDIVYQHNLRLLAMNEKGADIETMYMELTKNSEVNVK